MTFITCHYFYPTSSSSHKWYPMHLLAFFSLFLDGNHNDLLLLSVSPRAVIPRIHAILFRPVSSARSSKRWSCKFDAMIYAWPPHHYKFVRFGVVVRAQWLLSNPQNMGGVYWLIFDRASRMVRRRLGGLIKKGRHHHCHFPLHWRMARDTVSHHA